MMNKKSFINGGSAGLSFGITLIEKKLCRFFEFSFEDRRL